MPTPRSCPAAGCPGHTVNRSRAFIRYGRYHTAAHGVVQRYRCRVCGATVSDQTDSLHYFAKRRLPLKTIWHTLLAGASLREIARRTRVSPQAIQYVISRLGRQAMAAHALLLSQLSPRPAVVFDGLRSFVTSQDYPCDLTTVVERDGEMILSMVHSVSTRGGTTTSAQRARVRRKRRVWQPARGSFQGDISLLTREIWDYLRPTSSAPARIDTDRHPLYRAVLASDPVTRHLRRAKRVRHRRTSSLAPRTLENPLFPVNYIDRLLRHRLREHTRETIAFGRNATLQMHRAWIFAYDHNCLREYRVRRPELGIHAAQGALEPRAARTVNRRFFTRRIGLAGVPVPDSIRRTWVGELPTPPHRWRAGQQPRTCHAPRYALRDLGGSYQQARSYFKFPCF